MSTLTAVCLALHLLADVAASDSAPVPTATVTFVAFSAGGDIEPTAIVVGDAPVTTPTVLHLPAGTWAWSVAGRSMPPLQLEDGAFVDVIVTGDAAEVFVVGDPRSEPRSNSTAPRSNSVDYSDAWRDDKHLNSRSDPAAPLLTSGPTPPSETAAPATIVLRLRVTSLVDGASITQGRVYLRGGGAIAELGAPFVEVVVPTGASAISIVAPGFSPRVVTLNEPDDPDDATAVDVHDVVLAPLAQDLDDLTVSAPHIAGGLATAMSERREQQQLVEVLGAEQMAKSGDSDAASALKRVTGLTVVGGRYIYVRGLGDRYSSTLVNGAPLPSPEPEKRVVPLDLFPAALLESLVVQKTWSPDLPGEFGGGSVQLRTKVPRVDDRPLLSLGIGTTFTAGTTFVEHAHTPGGAFDALGIDDGSRALPASVETASRDQAIAPGNALTDGGFTRAELETFGEAMPRSWSTRPGLVGPGLSLNATAGHHVVTPLGLVSGLLALTWAQDALHTETARQLTTVGDKGDVAVTDDLRIASTEKNVALGGILALGYAPADGQTIRSVTLVNRAADDEARIVTGYNREIDADIRLTRLRFVQRQLVVQQLVGEHELPLQLSGEPLQLRWRANYALASRDEPDQRSTRYDDVAVAGEAPRFVLSDRSEGNQRLYSTLVDHAVDTWLAVRTPVALPGGFMSHVDVGGAFAVKAREVDTRRFKFVQTGPRAGDLDIRSQTPEAIFAPENIGQDGYTLTEVTRNTDNHTASSVVGAGFVALELPVHDDLTFHGGVRLEGARLEVTTFELFNANAAPVVALLQTLDALPSVGASWMPLDDLALKTSFARTVIRPELRELSPAVYTDVAGGRARFGNPDLQPTTIWHGDLRAEYAVTATDGASLAVFGKYFQQAIESVITAGADQAITGNNVDAAVNLGVEGEVRLSLSTVAETDVPVVRGLWAAANAALIFSRVAIGEAQRGTLTSKDRPLEGQSPWIGNLQLGTDDDPSGLSASIVYNVFGPRIVEVGALGLPDTLEQPFQQLDLVVRQRLPWGLSLSVKAQNLLDLPATRTQAGRVIDAVHRGRVFSAGLTWTW